MADNANASTNGHKTGNLFVDGDPDQVLLRSGRRTGTAVRPRRGRGLVVRLDPPAPATDAVRFTLPSGRLARMSAARGKLGQADGRAAELLRRLAARRYGALSAFVAVAAMLLALSWLGLALRNSAAAHHKAVRRETAATAAIEADRSRIASLNVELQQEAAAVGQAQAQATTAKQAQPAAHSAPPSAHSDKQQ